MTRLQGAMIALLVLWQATPARPAAPPYENAEIFDEPWVFPANPFTDKEPFKVAVVGGSLLTHHREHVLVSTQAVPLAGPARLKVLHLPPAPYPGQPWPPAGLSITATISDFPLRWHATQDTLYIAEAHCQGRAPVEYLRRYHLDDLVAGKVWTDLTYVEGRGVGPDARFTESSPGKDARMCGRRSEFPDGVLDEVFYDYLPDGDTGARQFVLTNARGTLVPRGKTDLIVGYWIKQTKEERTRPHWSFTVHRCQSKRDKKSGAWVPGPWSKEVDLPVAFKEHFQAFQRGDDWFFLTASGRLFVSRKPAKGARRSIDHVIGDKARPVLGTIVAPKEDKTFLFLDTAKGPAFFDLSDKPKPVVYDPKVAKIPEGDEPLKGIMHKARILAALGYVKVRAKAKFSVQD